MSSIYQPGEYSCEVLEQGFGQTKTGKDQLIFKFRVMDHVAHDADGNEVITPSTQQTEEYCYQTITPDSEKAMNYLMTCLRYAGFEGNDFSQMNFVGSRVRFKVEPNEYNGEVNDRWSMAAPPMRVAPFDNSAAKKMNALFDRQLKSQPAQQQTRSPEPAQEAPAGSPPNDEVPF